MIIDAWMQHPNAEWILNPMFELAPPLEARQVVGDEPTHRCDPCRDGSGGRLDWDALCVARALRADDQQR